MLFRRRKSQPAPSPAPMVDPVIDAQIHWLGSRGLVLRQDVSREDWIAAAEDPTDPIALAVAQLNGAYCTEPEPSVTIEPGSLPDMVNSLADGLELPIDEALLDGDQLTIRSGSTYEKYDVSEADVMRDPGCSSQHVRGLHPCPDPQGPHVRDRTSRYCRGGPAGHGSLNDRIG